MSQHSLDLPPGLAYDGPLVEAANGGGENDWVKYDKVKQYTNAWNGFGGKVDPEETPVQAAVRELQEEAGITAPLRQCGTLFFVVDGVDTAFNISVFSAYEYTGTITESEEMRPEWFSIQRSMLPSHYPLTTLDHGEASETLPPVPLQTMWADDEFWMPLMFARRYFVGRADFGADNKMRRWWFAAEPSPA
ncbi:hypothetical protein C8Q73DRAFT_794791 [Cubamyces lactineus]|nr:hypothetical protein C8Q73DRAFT_794791 [Cubamyces lactineus]